MLKTNLIVRFTINSVAKDYKLMKDNSVHTMHMYYKQ